MDLQIKTSRDPIPLNVFPLIDPSSLGSLACRFSLLPPLHLSSVSYIRWFASGIRFTRWAASGANIASGGRFIRWAASGSRFTRWAASGGRFIGWAASGLRLIRWAVNSAFLSSRPANFEVPAISCGRQGNTTYSRLQYQAKVFTIFTRRKIN
jgi:hypothetical protein